MTPFSRTWRQDFRWMVSILSLSLILTFYLTKSENRTKTSLLQPSYGCFEKRYYSCLKMLTFDKNNADASKMLGS